MADGRAKAVFNTLAPLFEEANYAIDLAASSMREPLGRGDVIDVPDISALTVTAAGSTTTSPQAITTNVLSLNANLEPWINAALPQLASMQLLDGKWAAQCGAQAVQMLKNSMDSDFCQYLVERNWTAAATYHTNVAGDSLTSDDVLNAIATLTNNKGVDEQDLVFLFSSWGRASLSSISGFVPNMAPATGVNGLPQVGTIYGVPCYQTSSIGNGRTLASTAFIDSGSATSISVAAGHGIAIGQKVTFSTVTSANDISTATAVTAADATSITVGASGGAGGATEAGTVTLECSENLLVSKSNTFIAQQQLPKTRIVPLSDSTGDALQISSIWGRVSRVGRAIVVCSPKSAI